MVYCRVKQRDRQLVIKRPELSNGFQGRVFKGKIWGDGCRVHDRLAGGEVTVVCQESQSSASGSDQSGVSAYSNHPPPGWGA